MPLFDPLPQQPAKSKKVMVSWNPWHGCYKLSPGCKYCFVYRADVRYGRNTTLVYKTQQLMLPMKRRRSGEFALPTGSLVATCFTSDFFLAGADEWRSTAW